MKDYKITTENIVEQRALFKNVPFIYNFLKRAFDILTAFAALIILSPIFLIVAAAIKIDSEGPVLFCQQRNGFKGKVFIMYKFRSMIIDAEKNLIDLEDKNQVSGFVFKIKNDPRVTNVGKIIRKTSIDELPQLLNILRGNMSFVGPRPPLESEVQKYDLWHNLRLSVKPGLTGLWQVSGRNNIGFEDMCRLDLKYIRERGMLYDLKIIFKTIPVLLGDSKAF
jgi:lipopolysaccharide/colanic/teichoic acid biosynthesis glycosyltransferase